MFPRTKFKVGMISTHPLSEGGVSNYTKNLVHSLTKQAASIVLFSNIPKKRIDWTKESDLHDLNICACWKRGLFYPFQIFKKVTKEDVNIIHVQHEFFLFGNSISALFFPFLLFLIKFLHKPIVVTLHGVVPLSEVNKQFLQENKLRGLSTILKLGSILSIKAILRLANAVIVHENCFRDVLKNDYKCSKKIFVIPHGIEKANNRMIQNEAKGKLGLIDRTLILYFGYISRYKGLETLIEGFGHVAEKHKDWTLIIGGGEHPRLRMDPSYKNYVKELHRRALTLAPHQTIFTGFIPEEELPIYFSAADLVVFPHNVTLSASGPLAFALGYQKPVLLSKILPFEETVEVKEAFFYTNSPKSLASRLEFLINDFDARREILEHIKKLTTKLSWDNVGLETIRLYENQLRVMH